MSEKSAEGKRRRNRSYSERRESLVSSGQFTEPKTKKCKGCGRKKKIARFPWLSRKLGRRHSVCEPCRGEKRNEYYSANVGIFVARNRRRYLRIISFVHELKSKPCTDCGRSFPPECMDFDHRDSTSKVDKVSRLAQNCGSKSKILEEIAKCDLVCANCHRIRTKRRSDERRKQGGG